MTTFEEDTINTWATQPGPINLRRTAHKPDTDSVMRPAAGTLLGVLIGLNMWIWGAVIWMAL